jgi:hypothetical protein
MIFILLVEKEKLPPVIGESFAYLRRPSGWVSRFREAGPAACISSA